MGRRPFATHTRKIANIHHTLIMGPRFSLFLRALGLKPGFRRTGPSSLVNIAFAAGLGVISGQYIFKEPLEEYWAEVRAREAAAERGGLPTNSNNNNKSNDQQS